MESSIAVFLKWLSAYELLPTMLNNLVWRCTRRPDPRKYLHAKILSHVSPPHVPLMVVWRCHTHTSVHIYACVHKPGVYKETPIELQHPQLRTCNAKKIVYTSRFVRVILAQGPC